MGEFPICKELLVSIWLVNFYNYKKDDTYILNLKKEKKKKDDSYT